MLPETLVAAAAMVVVTILAHFVDLTLLIALMRSIFVGGFPQRRKALTASS